MDRRCGDGDFDRTFFELVFRWWAAHRHALLAQLLAPPGAAKEVVAYWEDFFERLGRTSSWKKYVEENQVEDVFLKSRELASFLDEQTTLMRDVLRQAGVAVAR